MKWLKHLLWQRKVRRNVNAALKKKGNPVRIDRIEVIEEDY